MGHSKRTYDLLLKFWPIYKLGLWLGKQPGIGTVLKPVFSKKIHQVTMIPVNEAIGYGEQSVMPYNLLMQLVEQTSSSFIMSECVCRKQEGCKEHPITLGCMFLGDGAAQIHSSLGRLCEVQEAKAHIHRGLEAGLLPLIAHTMIDSVTLGISYKQMLTVCFCCECCCMVQRGLRNGPRSLLQVIEPIPGLQLTVGEECSGCGLCIEKCPVGAISANHRYVEINGGCKGCGICVQECPNDAIEMKIDGSVDFIKRFDQRMKSYADISHSNGKVISNLKP